MLLETDMNEIKMVVTAFIHCNTYIRINSKRIHTYMHHSEVISIWDDNDSPFFTSSINFFNATAPLNNPKNWQRQYAREKIFLLVFFFSPFFTWLIQLPIVSSDFTLISYAKMKKKIDSEYDDINISGGVLIFIRYVLFWKN